MTIQEKLNLFAKRTLESVSQKHREIAQENQNAIKLAVQNAEEEARRNMEFKLKSEKYRLEQEISKKVHAATMDAKRELYELRKRLNDELFNDLEKNLKDFMDSEAYQEFLNEGIENAKSQGLDDFTAEISEEGGFLLVSQDRRAVADYTFPTRLNALRTYRV